MFSPSASPCSSSTLKRKRDEFGAVISMNSCPSLADHSQACPPTASMGTLNLRGEMHSRTIKRTRNKPEEREIHGMGANYGERRREGGGANVNGQIIRYKSCSMLRHRNCNLIKLSQHPSRLRLRKRLQVALTSRITLRHSSHRRNLTQSQQASRIMC